MQVSDFPGTERDDGCVFTVNNKAYCFSGLEVGWLCTGNGFVFDGSSEVWTSTISSLPSGKERQYATAFSYSNNGYILGGIDCSNVCLNDLWVYNTLTNLWSALPNFPSQGRQGSCNFVLNNKAYIIGGKYSNGTISNEVWEYNITTSTWTQKNNLPFAGTFRGVAFQINNIGYTCFGLTNNGNFNRVIFQYNQSNDSWTAIPNITLPARNYIGCAVTSNKAFLYGGQDSTFQITNDVQLFDPNNNSVTTYSGIPTFGRKGGMAFALNNKFYFTTGVTLTARVKETWKNDQFVGIEETPLNLNDVKVFPNPSSEAINIQTDKDYINLILTSIIGEIVFEGRSNNISVKDLPNGVYNLNIAFNKGSINKKLIILH